MVPPCKNQVGSCILFLGPLVLLPDLQKLSIKLNFTGLKLLLLLETSYYRAACETAQILLKFNALLGLEKQVLHRVIRKP